MSARLKKKSEIVQQFDKNHKSCELCGERYGLQTHHIVARSIAPERISDEHNLVRLCIVCHTKVHNGQIDLFDHIKKLPGRIIEQAHLKVFEKLLHQARA